MNYLVSYRTNTLIFYKLFQFIQDKKLHKSEFEEKKKMGVAEELAQK